jgi:hypothetical protein
VQLGLGVCAHDPNGQLTATFQDVTLVAAPQ